MTRSEVINQLIRIRAEVADLIDSLEATHAPSAPPPPVPAPRQDWHPAPAPQGPRPAPARQGILQNPYLGPVDSITERSIALQKGGFSLKYILHTRAAKFETWDAKVAQIADEAIRTGKDVAIKWQERTNGTYVNYDAKGIRLAPTAQGVTRG